MTASVASLSSLPSFPPELLLKMLNPGQWIVDRRVCSVQLLKEGVQNVSRVKRSLSH